LKALKADDEALAREVALRIAECEAQRDEAQARVERLAQSVADQRRRIAQTETHIRRLKQQVDTVRASATVQRAQAAVAQRQAGSSARVRGALESLERIKHRQRERSARMESAAELDRERDDDALEAKLRSAGIIAEEDGADAVLARLKQRMGE
jgi:phage shock protein A